MTQILIFLFGAVVGGVVVWVATKKGARSLGVTRDDRSGNDNETEILRLRPQDDGGGDDNKGGGAGVGLIERQKQEKEANKRAILGLLETQGPLINNHVEQMLGIPESTVTRYFEELEHEGLVRQVGKTGPGVYYEKI